MNKQVDSVYHKIGRMGKGFYLNLNRRMGGVLLFEKFKEDTDRRIVKAVMPNGSRMIYKF